MLWNENYYDIESEAFESVIGREGEVLKIIVGVFGELMILCMLI